MPIAQTNVLGNLVGGLLTGVGMAAVGFCPGTVAAGAGEGRLDYLVAGGLGLYTGAIVFGLTYSAVYPTVANVGDLGPITMMQALHVDAWLVVVLFWELALLLFYAIERGAWRPLAEGHHR